MVVVKGMCLGCVWLVQFSCYVVDNWLFGEDEVEVEFELLYLVLDIVWQELCELCIKLYGVLVCEVNEFIDVYILLLDDLEMLCGFDDMICIGYYWVGVVFKKQCDCIVVVFEVMDDFYLCSWCEDVD